MYVVADIGDVDLERVIAVGQAIHPDGVVKVAGGFTVDGYDIESAVVFCGRPFRRRE